MTTIIFKAISNYLTKHGIEHQHTHRHNLISIYTNEQPNKRTTITIHTYPHKNTITLTRRHKTSIALSTHHHTTELHPADPELLTKILQALQ